MVATRQRRPAWPPPIWIALCTGAEVAIEAEPSRDLGRPVGAVRAIDLSPP